MIVIVVEGDDVREPFDSLFMLDVDVVIGRGANELMLTLLPFMPSEFRGLFGAQIVDYSKAHSRSWADQ